MKKSQKQKTPNTIKQENETFEKVGKVMAEIEVSKQKATLAQIEATREDNQRQYDFAVNKLTILMKD
ncbi:hypothetical protein LGF16_001755 [Campylobacter coli]|nr:hypothetical protein [Campylobacter coli]EIG9356007.1 hypothetical protein [Campylobacter coli]